MVTRIAAAVGHVVIALVIALLVAIAAERTRITAVLPALITALTVGSMITLAALVANHVGYPFHLGDLEGVVQQHARRALHGEPIYSLPSPAFVPLAYNALYYLLAVPFLVLLGDSLAALRVVSILGYLGAGAAIYGIVRRHTRSAWWGASAVGLFFAAYGVMDAYLDIASADSWLLCTALWGTLLVDGESRGSRLAGVLVLTASFWFKQHGAIFLGAALVYLTWRGDLRSAAAYWLAAIVGGPLLYVFMPTSVVGPAFRFFTWQVPSGWSHFTSLTIPRVIAFVALNYLVLAGCAFVGAHRALRQRSLGALEFMMGAAIVTACMGALDPGSSNNVFIPLGAFCIVSGSIELARMNERVPRWHGSRPALVGLLVAFAMLLRDPRAYWIPASARAAYADLQETLRTLPGPVYAPAIGQFSDGVALTPTAHWVALEDILRGPRRTAADSALARRMLDGVRHPAQSSFVLTVKPLADLTAPVNELTTAYVLVQDYGQRFAVLRTLPRRWGSTFPRYLYRSTSDGALTHVP